MASLTSGTRKISFSKENKIHFRGSLAMPQRDFTPKVQSPLTMNHPSQFRPEYKRTMSTKIIQSPSERRNYGHRRTQSLNMPQTQINQTYGVRSELRKGLYNRSSANIANTREFYAAPAYNEASFLERKESMRSSTRSISSSFMKFDYQASSPDEKALVEGCAKIGFVFTGEKNSVLNIKLQSQRVSEIPW